MKYPWPHCSSYNLCLITFCRKFLKCERKFVFGNLFFFPFFYNVFTFFFIFDYSSGIAIISLNGKFVRSRSERALNGCWTFSRQNFTFIPNPMFPFLNPLQGRKSRALSQSISPSVFHSLQSLFQSTRSLRQVR